METALIGQGRTNTKKVGMSFLPKSEVVQLETIKYSTQNYFYILSRRLSGIPYSMYSQTCLEIQYWFVIGSKVTMSAAMSLNRLRESLTKISQRKIIISYTNDI
jgi:hypothetical protein